LCTLFFTKMNVKQPLILFDEKQKEVGIHNEILNDKFNLLSIFYLIIIGTTIVLIFKQIKTIYKGMKKGKQKQN
jgi:hypothetical protein